MCLYSQGIFQKEDNSLKVQWRLGMSVYCVLCEARTLGMRCRADRNNGAQTSGRHLSPGSQTYSGR